MRTLNFTSGGNDYIVNEKGHINGNGIGYFSPKWIFLGGSRHHWRNGIDVTLKEAFDFPGLLDGCIGWDIDHGTTRKWGGKYYGKIPRISGVFVR